jgi:hypothetical protein
MKKFLFLILLLTAFDVVKSQNVTDLNRELDSLFNSIKISDVLKARKNFYGFVMQLERKTAKIALKYSGLKDGMEILYNAKNAVSKDTLQAAVNSAPDSVKNSLCAKALQKYILSEQIQKGGKLKTFEVYDSLNQRFDWSTTEKKNLLLVYDGMDCMGEKGRKELSKLYDKTDRKKLEIVVFIKSKNFEDFRQQIAKYDGRFTYISDFNGEYDDFQTFYPILGTPSYYYFDKEQVLQNMLFRGFKIISKENSYKL